MFALIDKASANDLTLQHFRVVQMSEAWDGVTECSDGDTWRMLIYRDKIVASNRATRIGGSVQVRSRQGGDFWWDVFSMSVAYMAILKIARYKYFDCKEPFLNIDASVAGWDVVRLNDELKSKLFQHPQYTELVEMFGMKLVSLPQGHRVDVRKRATPS